MNFSPSAMKDEARNHSSPLSYCIYFLPALKQKMLLTLPSFDINQYVRMQKKDVQRNKKWCNGTQKYKYSM